MLFSKSKINNTGQVLVTKRIGRFSRHTHCIEKAKVTKVERVTSEVRFYNRFSSPSTEAQTSDSSLSQFIAAQVSPAVQCSQYVYLFLEFYQRGDLFQLWMQKHGLLEADAKFVTRNLIEVVQKLHDNGVVLRDIKPENWVVDNKGYLRLIDFNHAGFLEDSEDRTLNEVVGTIGYMSPEVLKAKKSGYGTQADVWWIGWLIYEILCGKLPFKETEKISINAASLLSPVEYYKYWSRDLKDLLSKIFINSPQHRITLQKMLEHPWLSGYTGDWSIVLSNSPLLSENVNDINLKSTSTDGSNQQQKDSSNVFSDTIGRPNVLNAIIIPEISKKPNKEEQLVPKRQYSYG